MSMTLGELAVRFGCTLKGDPQIRVSHVATLERAEASAIAFLANPRYRRYLAASRAGAVVLDPKFAEDFPGATLLSKNPYATYARIAALLHPPRTVAAGVHPAAVVDPAARVDVSASIGPGTVVEADVVIGARAVVGPGCVLLRGSQVGADTRLVANVTLCEAVEVAERCLLHPGVVIGADGFGLAQDDGRWIKVPQIGSVRIGADVEIGANTTIDRGAIEDTVIGEGVKLDNQIQVGHNVKIGAHTAIAGCSGISGSTTIGSRCMLGGKVGVAGHLSICDDVVITGKSFVSSSIHKPGYYSSGLPVEESAKFRKNAARFYQLDELARQVRTLRRTVFPQDAVDPDAASGEAQQDET
jgi:UDP-3-O-[3-hydroxymyristoyl] glucosamine N-acyltransferase